MTAPRVPWSTRRSFMKRSAASLVVLGGAGALGVRWAHAQASLAAAPPSLDGELLVDDAARRGVAGDFGGHVSRSPVAVLRPGSVADVVRIVGYANTHGIKIAMRGQGHCVSGQAQVDGGIVIDSSTLHTVRVRGDSVDAEPGALWGDVAKATLGQGLTPPVMPDAMMLSMGGTLSVGGTGETSYRSGAQVDHVLELDVVTGTGQLVTCSAERNAELFQMMLGGLGQCGIIVRARLRLVQAPRDLAMYSLTYDGVDGLLADQARLATVEGVGLLGGLVIREPDGRWRCVLVAGTLLTQREEGGARPSWMTGLRYKAESGPAKTSYWDYLDRRTNSVRSGRSSGRPNPSLALTVPDAAALPFLTHVMSTPSASIGIWRIEVFPMITARFTQPLHKIPAGPMAFTLRFQRRASAPHARDHETMLAANRALLPRMRAAGGKIYPPFAPILSRAEWEEHYGPETWTRFAAAKKQFDPNNVLTPGAGIF